MYTPRQLAAYATISVFVVVFLLYGLLDSTFSLPRKGTSKAGRPKKELALHPDLSKYKPLRTLSAEEFPLDNPDRRVVIVGDVHGMAKPLNKLLDRLDYQPSKDVLVHVGDIISKGSHKGSLAILEYLASHNITGVRGNHDQKVVEWRAWLDWISTQPGGREWLQRLDKRWNTAKTSDDIGHDDFDSWFESCNTSQDAEDKQWLKHVPKGWVLFSDHYKIARDMSMQSYEYLLELPLILHIPTAHTFIVHAGILPLNPVYEMDDKEHQPLARVPPFPKRFANGSNIDQSTIESLRYLQEVSILTDIPQNTVPWVLLNMRNVAGDKIRRKSGRGKPWSKIWNAQMRSCIGYDRAILNRSLEDLDDDEDDGTVEDGDTDDYTSSANPDGIELPCYPSTTIYGHAAARGLDIKRWTIGLDTGCVYDGKLSALVLGGTERKGPRGSEDGDEEDPSINKNRHRSIPFGDKGKAKIVSVGC